MEQDPEALWQTSCIDWAKQYLSNVEDVKKDAHGDQSEVYHIQTPIQNFILKVAPDLQGERDRIDWLQGKLPVPVLTNFGHIDEKDVLLMTELKGRNLASLAKDWPVEDVVRHLAATVRMFHYTDIKDCPFGERGQGKVLIHGDACLPNFIFEGSHFSGYIDLGDTGIGDPEIDLSAAIWSLQYNLGPGYGTQFLQEYGYSESSEGKVEELRLRYEDMQRAWGLSN
jgi:aminoglycoside phosphotransferase